MARLRGGPQGPDDLGALQSGRREGLRFSMKPSLPTPVFFHYSTMERQTVTVHLPEGYVAGTLPKPITASRGGNSYSLSVTLDPAQHTLEIQRASTNGEIKIAPADYVRSRDWFRQVSAADQIGIVLKRAAEGAPSPPPHEAAYSPPPPTAAAAQADHPPDWLRLPAPGDPVPKGVSSWILTQ